MLRRKSNFCQKTGIPAVARQSVCKGKYLDTFHFIVRTWNGHVQDIGGSCLQQGALLQMGQTSQCDASRKDVPFYINGGYFGQIYNDVLTFPHSQ